MRPAVRDAFVGFSTPLEGRVSWLYLDVKGLVTTGMGNLVDPVALCINLPFVTNDGELATQEEIAAAWSCVKSHQEMALRGGGAFKHLTHLRLTDAGIDSLVQGKLAQNDAHLARRFDGYANYPADAQLALLSMAWACGPAFRFPMLEGALFVRDFMAASKECHMEDSHNPGLRPRNAANKLMFENAAWVTEYDGDRDVLRWPNRYARHHDTPQMIPLPFEPSTGDGPLPSSLTEAAEAGIEAYRKDRDEDK